MSGNRQTAKAGDNSTIVQSTGDVHLNIFDGNFPTEVIDEQIDSCLDRVIKSRFFQGYDSQTEAIKLKNQILDGRLQLGSSIARCRGLAWCARLLVTHEPLQAAEFLVNEAQKIGECWELSIAEALITWKKGDTDTALSKLSELDTPTAKYISYFILTIDDGLEEAHRWLAAKQFSGRDFDTDGQFLYISHLHQLGKWNEAFEFVERVGAADLAGSPVLCYIVAVTNLCSVMHDEFRDLVILSVPFHAAECRFIDTDDGLAVRRKTRSQFEQVAESARILNLPQVESTAAEYVLWLMLSDPDCYPEGRQRLEEMLRNPETTLGVVHLALQYGVELDIQKIENDIQSSQIVNRGTTKNAAYALYAIAMSQSSSIETAKYISQHFEEISTHFDRASLLHTLICIYCETGQRSKAEQTYSLLQRENSSEELLKQSRTIIDAATGGNRVEALKIKYEESHKLVDLIILLQELESASDQENLVHYSRQLYESTNSERDLQRLVHALSQVNEFRSVVEVLRERKISAELPRSLSISFASALYETGALLEARQELDGVESAGEEPRLRALSCNIALAMGEISQVDEYIGSEVKAKSQREPQELIHSAQLALMVGSRHSKSLLFSAARTGKNDPQILGRAYFLATNAGLESNPEVFSWLQAAADLSDEDGPIQRVDLDFILERSSDWDAHEHGVSNKLERGEIPIFIAAQSINRSLTDLSLFPALSNLEIQDIRRKAGIPGFSGARSRSAPRLREATVAIDLTSLLTLGFLELLDETLKVAKHIVIAHSTQAWLLRESFDCKFHQPTRIAGATQILNLVARSKIEQLSPAADVNADLANLIGEDLASLLAEAEIIRDDGKQHLVVQPAPVHIISSRMREHADMSAHEAILVSTASVVNFLREKGYLLQSKEDHCRAYLKLNEKCWPTEPTITDQATLYLDRIAINHLQHLNLLEDLCQTVVKVVVPQSFVRDCESLVMHAKVTEAMSVVLDQIREMLYEGIDSGQVTLSAKGEYGLTDSSELFPTVELFSQTQLFDVLVVDDRFLNQNQFADESRGSKIFSTLDLIDELEEASVISDTQKRESRAKLRKAGYFFIDCDKDELAGLLLASQVMDGSIIATAELKAFGESILQLRMKDTLQLPKEHYWFKNYLQTIVDVLKILWKSECPTEETVTRSQWLLDHLDVRQWAHIMHPENPEAYIEYCRGPIVNLLLINHLLIHSEHREAYVSMIDSYVLSPIRDYYPLLYSQILDWHVDELEKMVEQGLEREAELEIGVQQ